CREGVLRRRPVDGEQHVLQAAGHKQPAMETAKPSPARWLVGGTRAEAGRPGPVQGDAAVLDPMDVEAPIKEHVQPQTCNVPDLDGTHALSRAVLDAKQACSVQLIGV